MKHKTVTRKLTMIAAALCLSLTILASPIASVPVQAAPAEDTVMPLSDFIEWRFKIEGTSLYKRLFNYSTSEWIGEWEYVCEVKFKGGGNH